MALTLPAKLVQEIKTKLFEIRGIVCIYVCVREYEGCLYMYICMCIYACVLGCIYSH